MSHPSDKYGMVLVVGICLFGIGIIGAVNWLIQCLIPIVERLK